MKENNDHSSLGNPFDHRQSLIHGRQCDCHQCHSSQPSIITSSPPPTAKTAAATTSSADDVMDRMVESALVRGMFGHSDMHRRQFM